MELGSHSWMHCRAADTMTDSSRNQEEGGAWSWVLIARWIVLLLTEPSRDQEQGGGWSWVVIARWIVQLLTEPSRDQEQGDGWSWALIARWILAAELFLNSCFSDTVFVTLLSTAVETAISRILTQVAWQWRANSRE